MPAPKALSPHLPLELSSTGWLQNPAGEVLHVKSPKYTPYHSKKRPRIILLNVWHYNAGPDVPDLRRYTDLMLNVKRRVSSHFYIDREGRLAQYVSTHAASWHAGKSQYRDPRPTSTSVLRGINRFSLGIEMENAGKLNQTQNGKYQAWWGQAIPPSQVIIAAHKHSPGKEIPWQTYTPKQLTVAQRLSEALFSQIDTLQENVGHDDISRGRKIDPGPAFPLTRLNACYENRA